MKKRDLLLFLISFLFVNVNSVNASTCTYSEQAKLNKDVANIKVTYEEATGKVDPSLYDCQADAGEEELCNSEYDYFVISVLNMTEDFYIVVTNNVDGQRQTFYYSDSQDGVIKFNWEGILNLTTFTISVYSSSETGCPRENYRTIYFTTPRKNLYHYYGQCQQAPDYYICDKYVTFEEMSFYEFMEKMDAHISEIEKEDQEKLNPSLPEKIVDYIYENKVTFITVGVAMVIITTVVTIIVVKKRKKSVL